MKFKLMLIPLILLLLIGIANAAVLPPKFKVTINDYNTVDSVAQGKVPTIYLNVQNVGGSGTMFVECGIYEKRLVDMWGLDINPLLAWIYSGISDRMSNVPSCISSETNVDTVSLTLAAGQTQLGSEFALQPVAPTTSTSIDYIIFCDAYKKCYDSAGTKAAGTACTLHSECGSSYCYEGKCDDSRVTSYDAARITLTGSQNTMSCTDGIANQDESDTDCGGVCKDCNNGYHCIKDGDCSSGFCDLSEPEKVTVGSFIFDVGVCEDKAVCTNTCLAGQTQAEYPSCACSSPGCTNVCSAGQSQAAYPTCTCSGTNVCTVVSCPAGQVQNPYPNCACGGSSTEPRIFAWAQRVSVDGNVVRGWMGLQNNGGSMTKNYLVEMQVRPKGGQPLAWVGAQATCDASTPENVHKAFSLAAGESQEITLESVVKAGDYDVWFVTVDKCYAASPVGNMIVAPFGSGTFIGSVTVSGIVPSPDTNWLLILGIVLAIILLGLVGYYLYAKYKK